jgi:hypothetical protein
MILNIYQLQVFINDLFLSLSRAPIAIMPFIVWEPTLSAESFFGMITP